MLIAVRWFTACLLMIRHGALEVSTKIPAAVSELPESPSLTS